MRKGRKYIGDKAPREPTKKGKRGPLSHICAENNKKKGNAQKTRRNERRTDRMQYKKKNKKFVGG